MCAFVFFIGRQTSDPKSGFATVEKDLPGGLTPMLGDRKVILIFFFFSEATQSSLYNYQIFI